MSRLDELKKQYPHLNVSFIDVLKQLDDTKSYKYLPLLCKLFGRRFNLRDLFDGDLSKPQLDVQTNLIERGISTNNLNYNEMFVINELISQYLHIQDIETFRQFKEYNENNLIDNNDISNYNKITDLLDAISLVSIKTYEKELENQIIKVYEDDNWVFVKPLTFSASSKYGAGTKWCTTYTKEKNYFERYWRLGILVYFINKKTGYKFAGYKALYNGIDLSFWNSADLRVDFLDLEIEDYLYPIIKKIFNGNETNKNLCSDTIQTQVMLECDPPYAMKESYDITREEEVEARTIRLQTNETEVSDAPNHPTARLVVR